MSNLTARPRTGRDKAYRLLEELAAAGYVQRRQIHDAQGRFAGWEYLVFDEPQPSDPPLPENPDTAGPFPEKPYTAQPYTAKPEAANQLMITNYRDIQNTEMTKSLIGAQALRPAPSTWEEESPAEPPPPSPPAAGTPPVEKPPVENPPVEKPTPLMQIAEKAEPPSAETGPATGRSSRRAARRDGVGELAAALGLAGWQTNFARVAVREERTRTAWYYLARQHPEVLKASYRLLDKTGERGTVTWATWLPMLAEDVRTFGAGRVAEALETAIAQATPKGCWGYYRARVEGRPRGRGQPAEPPSASGYSWADFERDYGFASRREGGYV